MTAGVRLPVMRVAAMMVVAAVLSGCATTEARLPSGPLQGTKLTSLLDDKKATRLGDPFIRAGLKSLEISDFVEAQKGFNRALKFDPTNSQLHFLNGLTYQLRAAAGDTS